MFDIIKSAIVPKKIPKKSWLNITDEIVAPSRASNPSAAEVKIKKPTITRMITVTKNGRSTVFFIFIPLEVERGRNTSPPTVRYTCNIQPLYHG